MFARTASAFSAAVLSSASAVEALSEALELDCSEAELFPLEHPVRRSAAARAAIAIFFFIVLSFLSDDVLYIFQNDFVSRTLEVQTVVFCVFMQEVSVVVGKQRV